MSDELKNADGSDQAADDSSTLETELAAKMEALRGGGVQDDGDASGVTKDEDAGTEKDESNTEDEAGGKKDDSPLLPSGHRRAALARGYTSEEVDHYLETKPDEAVARFEEIFDEWQKENSRWSDRGRQLHAAGQTAAKKDEDKSGKSSEALPHFDAEGLIREHGNEDLINALVTPLNATIDRVNAATERISHSEDFLRDTEQNALTIATQDFLTSKEMESFKDTYGTEIKDLTDEQVKNRMELFGEADILVAGAKDHGKDITVQDALERAHIIVSQGTRDEGIRQSIRASLKKRTKTTRTTHQQISSTDEDQLISDEELEKRTNERLRALRNK